MDRPEKSRDSSPDPQRLKRKASGGGAKGHSRERFRHFGGESRGIEGEVAKEVKGSSDTKRIKLGHPVEKREDIIWSRFHANMKEINTIIHQNFFVVPEGDLEKCCDLIEFFNNLLPKSEANVYQLANYERQSEQWRDYFHKQYKDIICSRLEANIKEIIKMTEQNTLAVRDDLKKCDYFFQSFNRLLESPEANVYQLANYERQSEQWRDYFRKQYKDIICSRLEANIKEIIKMTEQNTLAVRDDLKKCDYFFQSFNRLLESPEANAYQLANYERQSEQWRDYFREKYPVLPSQASERTEDSVLHPSYETPSAKEQYEKILGGNYEDKLKKEDRLEAITNRFNTVQSFIEQNRDHISNADREQFDNLVKQARDGERAARASKRDSTKEQRYIGERDYRDATRDLVTMEERLKEGLKHQAEEDFRQLMDSPEKDATRIAGELERILNDRIKEETIKDTIRNFGEFIPWFKALNAIYESIRDYSDCNGKFQKDEANLSFARVRAKITEGYWHVAGLKRNEQFPQGRLRDFTDEQVKRLDEAIDGSKREYERIGKTKETKNQVELEYLTTWIKQMEDARTTINKQASVFKDAPNLTLAGLKTFLKGFLWELKTSLEGSPRDQLGPRRSEGRSEAAAFNKAHFPTPAPRDETVVDNYHGYEVSDPYRPLENLKDERTSQYMQEEHKERFLEYIAPVEGKDELTAYYKDICDSPWEDIPNRYGDTYFSQYNDGKSSQGVYRIRDTLEGKPRTLIDPNDRKDPVFSLEGTLLVVTHPSPDGKWVAYMTSKGDHAEGTIHIRNVATGEDLPSEIKTGCFVGFECVSWDRDSKGFQYRYPSGDLKYYVLKHFGLDTPEQNPTVFELKQDGGFLEGYYLHDQSGEDGAYDFVKTSVDTRYAIYIKQHGSDKPYDQLFAGDDSIKLDPVAEVNGKIYAVTNLDAPRKHLVAIDPNNSQPDHWEEILRPEGQDIMQWAKVHQGHLIIGYTHDIANQVALYSMDGKTLQSKVPLPEQSTVSCGRLNKGDTTLLLSISGYQSPGDKYKYHIDENRLELWKRSEAKVDLRDAIIERIDVPFKDNKGHDILIPMTVIRSQDTKLDGTAALKLVGYGGFNILDGVPHFILDACVWTKKKGGIYAYINNLPGDGLSGSEGYNRGRLHNKKNVFDAYCACAEELVRRKYTSSERLIAEGSSNGGLTVLASVLKRPDLFGAVVADVPPADMYRYTEHTPYWKTDFGNPKESKEDFESTSGYDPLRKIRDGEDYPPILIKTSMNDPIVHPSHSSKFLATFHEKASPESLCVMRVSLDTGHGTLSTRDQRISDRVETCAFLERAIGPINQNEYKEAEGIS